MSGSPARVDTFRHEALLYAGWADFVAGTVPFIREGLDAGEPVLVVESPEKIDLLRTALDHDADRVMFADMAEVGANPARIIPAWHDFVQRQGAGGKPLRGIGEPIWNGRTADELIECQRHESLLNVAFGSGRPWWLLCPYDVSQLDDSVIAEARRSHEYVSHGGSVDASHDFRGFEASGAPFDVPFAEPQTPPMSRRFHSEGLFSLRGDVVRFAMEAGVAAERAAQFVTAVNEVATNSVVHGGGAGTLRLWRDVVNLVCEIRDSGRYDKPLADRDRPGSASADSRGLWLANHLCDLVQIRNVADGTAVRLHLKIDPKRRLRVV